MKQYQSTANLFNSQKFIVMSLLAIGSTTVLVGCQNTPSASNTPVASVSPSAASTPVVSKTPDVSSTPNTSSSTTSTGNIKKAEAALKSLYTQQAGVPIDSVSCPENANLKVGGTFECQAKAQGVSFGIQVKMENDKGKFDSKTRGLLILTKIEELLQKSIKEKAKIDVKADCGSPKLRAAKAGETFTCQVKDAKGQSKQATIEVKDESGNINVSLK